jgi:1,4-alpha-glucan branching enzyme
VAIKKQYLKTKPVCKVTFKIPPEVAPAARAASVVGDFNEWNRLASPMKRLKSGAFTLTLDLAPDRAYQFRYLIDGSIWENETEADHTVPTPFADAENSVVVL